MSIYKLFDLNMRLFDNTNKTTDNELSAEMKTYYSKYLITLAEPELVHDQFGQKQQIPANGGKNIEFRKYASLGKAMTPLQEGVTPSGQKLNVSTITSTVAQYGGYVELSDVLLLTAIDNNLVHATELIAGQAGRTLDTVTREVLNGGTNVLYAGSVTSRKDLEGGESTGNEYLTCKDIRRAVRVLKKFNTPKFNGSYWGIVHPDCEFDIQDDPEWQKPHQYVDTKNIYENEIGMIAGVRFVESTEAKVFHAANLTAEARELSVKTAISGTPDDDIAVKEAISSAEATALAGRKIILEGTSYTIVSATAGAAGSAAIKIDTAIEIAADKVIYPGEAGAKGRDVYSTLIGGSNAYGVTEIEGGGLKNIIKTLGSAGSADPLDQRATTGWKAQKTAERLVEEYMVRVESTTSFNDIGEN